MPRRFHGNDYAGTDGAYTWSRSTKYDYTDDNNASGRNSRSESLASGNNKHLMGSGSAGACGRNCCLITLLILGALLLAIGLGLLVYYLLLNCKYIIKLPLLTHFFIIYHFLWTRILVLVPT